MRFLKKKIALAKAFEAQGRIKPQNVEEHDFRKENVQMLPDHQAAQINVKPYKRNRIPGFSSIPQTSRATKNIVKNYGKAICNFATSTLSLPYLRPILQKEGVEWKDFIDYINNIKQKVNGLYHFRSVLLPSKKDSKEMEALKRIFKDISEIFIKYFSVNWIFHSKIQYKEAHLKFRFMMLRRIKNPELFTYLVLSKNKKKIMN